VDSVPLASVRICVQAARNNSEKSGKCWGKSRVHINGQNTNGFNYQKLKTI
jgi:hypothetical protein